MNRNPIRRAFVSGGVVYHHALVQPCEPFAGYDLILLGDLASVDLNHYDLVVVPRSTDGEALHARRHQVARYLDHGGVLVAFGEMWSEWFPGCQWGAECAADLQAPVIARDHPLVAGYTPNELQWHPPYESWCCHGHLVAPPGAEVLVQNARGDAWLYVDRASTNGVIVAATNLDPDTHLYHGNETAGRFLARLLAWAEAEALHSTNRRQRQPKKIAGLYSGVHFQKSFYEDAEFAPRFAILPVWELAATNLHDYAALWVPRESNQAVLVQHREKIAAYLESAGTLISFEQVNQPWLPAGSWSLRPTRLEGVRLADHPLLASLSVEDVNWHSHGAYDAYPQATVLVDDGEGAVLLFVDEQSFAGRLLAGTMDPDCHAGFGSARTRPLLRAILAWIGEGQQVAVSS